MMKGLAVSVLAAVLFGLTVGPAPAFVLQVVNGDGVPLNPRWPSMPVHFKLNDGSLEILRPLSPGSTPLQPLQAALHTWSVAPVDLTFDGTTPAADAVSDRINLITFADSPRNREWLADSWGTTITWTQTSGGAVSITEADVVLNPHYRFATDGSPDARDLPTALTYSLGWALGLDNSPIAADSLFPLLFAGQTASRSQPEPDDLAGLHVLYGGADPGQAAIAGQVLTLDNEPVFGAHVVATDSHGIVRVASLTDWNGSFTLPGLTPTAGPYRVYAEPLDGAAAPGLLGPAYRDARNDFRTAFAGGNSAPAVVPLAAGQTTALDPIHVDARPATINPKWLAWSPDGTTFLNSLPQVLEIERGQSAYLAVVGAGLQAVPRSGFRFNGGDIRIDASHLVRGIASNGVPYAIIQLQVDPLAAPGTRSLDLITPDERAVLTGCIRVVSR
jgi:hypothetical protein